ncbi:MAG: PorT family protein [Cytophagales bacterium]|nr:PorT family protein [Cytophagales bacterium]
MRKLFFLTSLLVLISLQTLAQGSNFKLGIKVAPVIHSTRILLDDQTVAITNDGSNTKLSFGLVVDKSLTDSYVFSTGLIYIPKEVMIDIAPDAANPIVFNNLESYKLQYLQIPLTLKLFTNEIKPDVRAFFQLGMALDIKVYEEADLTLVEPEVIAQFQPINIPVVLGGGFEYNLGINTVFFGEVSYHRGLNNIVKTTNVSFEQDLEMRSTILSIDLGIKF